MPPRQFAICRGDHRHWYCWTGEAAYYWGQRRHAQVATDFWRVGWKNEENCEQGLLKVPLFSGKPESTPFWGGQQQPTKGTALSSHRRGPSWPPLRQHLALHQEAQALCHHGELHSEVCYLLREVRPCSLHCPLSTLRSTTPGGICCSASIFFFFFITKPVIFFCQMEQCLSEYLSECNIYISICIHITVTSFWKYNGKIFSLLSVYRSGENSRSYLVCNKPQAAILRIRNSPPQHQW